MANKMTRAQMVEKLKTLQVGSKIVKDGKVYTVMGLRQERTALCRTDLGILEDGKPETYEKPGKYLAAGKMLTFSNIESHTWYAQAPYMNWERLA